MARIRCRIKDLVKELHRKTALWLCKNYETIVIPDMGTVNMVKKQDRRIGSKTARSLLTWCHGAFREWLKNKAGQFVNAQNESPLVISGVDESYTSKTCGHCGFDNPKTGSKQFVCRRCNFQCDRDVAGARNIGIRWLGSIMQ